MPAGTIEVGLLEQAFVHPETTFNDNTYVSGILAADAWQHRQMQLGGKLNRVPSPEKRGVPSRATSLPRRFTADWNMSQASWQPSGTLGTASDLGEILKAGIGSQVASGSGSGVTTTVSASPSPTATGVTVASATGMAVGDVIVVTMPSGLREVTRIKTIATNALTFDALSGAPASGAAVVDGVTYKLTTAVGNSLAILKAYTAAGKQEVVTGALVEQIDLTFDGSTEVMIAAQGPAAQYRRSGATVPGSQTLAGAPVASFDGNDFLDGNQFLMTNLKVTFKNNIGLRNMEIGTKYATGKYRNTFRDTTVSATFYFDDTNLQNAADAIQRQVVRHVSGNVNGSMVGVVIPVVEWEVPPVAASGDGPLMVTATGVAYGANGNDEIFLFEA